MKTVVIVANGKRSTSFLPRIGSKDCIIGVDRGALWLLRHKVIPDVAIGDFDSVTASERKTIQEQSRTFIKYPSCKDATDLELAVDYTLRLQPQSVVIYGASGSRLDHVLASFYLLEKFLPHNISAEIRDSRNRVFLTNSLYQLTPSTEYRYVSLFPYSEQAVVTLRSFKYELTRFTFRRGTTRGVSNELTGRPASIIVHEGIVLVVMSRD